MTSQISTHKLLRLELKQTLWMFALSALGQFMAGPVLFLMSIGDYYSTVEITVSRHRSFISGAYLLCQILLIIMCICFTIFSNRYLFSKRMVDLYHSAPITRGKLFTVKYIHGLLVWLLPFLAFSITVPLLSFLRLNTDLTLQYAVNILSTYAGTLLLSVFCFFIFYHLYLVALYLSGNVLNMFANVAIMGFSVICLYVVVWTCAEQYFNTFCTEPFVGLLDVLFALSPFTSPFVVYAYMENSNSLADLFQRYSLFFVLCLLLSIGLLFLARRIYQKRPSELAERGTLNKPYTEVAKYVISFLVSVAMSLFFGELIYGSMGLFWSIFGAFFGGILSYGALNSIFHSTIKAFFKQKLQMGLITLFGILFITSFQLDWFGYDTYLPKKDQIAGMAVYMYGLSDSTAEVTILNPNSADIDFRMNTSNQRVLQENLLTDKDICYDFLKLAVSHEKDEYPNEQAAVTTSPTDTYVYYTREGATYYATEGSRSVFVKVELESGRTYYRRYELAHSDYEKLRPFVESDDYRLTNYKLSSGLMGYPDEMNLYLRDHHTSLDMSEDNIKGLMDAYYQDFAEHYTLEELTSHMYSVSLEMQFYNSKGINYYYSVNVPACYTRTMDYLAELYPMFVPFTITTDEIISITPYQSRSIYTQYGGYARYFGIEGAEVSEHLTEILDELDQEYVDYEVSDMVTVERAVSVEYKYEGSADGAITDADFIEKVLPYLYYGDYEDMFGFREYISFGSLRTTTGYVDCYVKANTLPLEIIDYLEDGVTLNAK